MRGTRAKGGRVKFGNPKTSDVQKISLRKKWDEIYNEIWQFRSRHNIMKEKRRLSTNFKTKAQERR